MSFGRAFSLFMLTVSQLFHTSCNSYKAPPLSDNELRLKKEFKNQKYESLISKLEKPAIYLNKEIMEKFRPELKKFYYDPSKFKTYLEQLGIQYPTVKEEHRKEFSEK